MKRFQNMKNYWDDCNFTHDSVLIKCPTNILVAFINLFPSIVLSPPPTTDPSRTYAYHLAIVVTWLNDPDPSKATKLKRLISIFLIESQSCKITKFTRNHR